LDPKGRVALITGGARIGEVGAHALAARGWALALTYRGSREAAEMTAAAARAVAPATVLRANATDESQGVYGLAIAGVKEEGTLRRSCRVRPIQYLNNILEQNHGAIKRRVKAKQSFREFRAARRTNAGYEAMHMIRKGQARVSDDDVRKQNHSSTSCSIWLPETSPPNSPLGMSSVTVCRDLVARMARENFLWCAPRIHGELLMLASSVSQATVSRYCQHQAQGQHHRGRASFAIKSSPSVTTRRARLFDRRRIPFSKSNI
jgi:NAD(P)-dependent dehydrogenase (short-subunit alcohol dehydrogenase family)